jgi:GH15 family glucan-1,4-alpha-glucosidase
MHSARRAGLDTSDEDWAFEKDIVDFVIYHWRDPDWGLWEVRSGPEHFVHSKVMAWVAVDRAVAAVERFGKEGPVDAWIEAREAIRGEVLERGLDRHRGVFVRSYEDPGLDASLLTMPLVGFIDVADPRMRQTIEAIERELVVDGFVQRYLTHDGLPGGEGAFLMCTCWLVDCLVLLGRHDDAVVYFERVADVANDVGLLAEEYDTALGRMVGNFPQAFSHTAVIASAMALSGDARGPITRRR